jgi:hypothetical protein
VENAAAAIAPMSWTRRWHRIGSAWLLIAAGSHLPVHWGAYVATGGFDPARRELMQAMQSFVVYEPLGTTMWTVLGFFSLSFSALLALWGTTHWVLAREADPRTLRRHALRNAVLCLLATAGIGALHLLPQGMLIFAVAAVLFGLAAWPRALDL